MGILHAASFDLALLTLAANLTVAAAAPETDPLPDRRITAARFARARMAS